ncbi:hypothetical protein HNQ60_005220 [Povalibacter uvarum]|uniref:Ice-binding protein C-terminal domain-containing protein n=1 Tax=Povalibacter uvarum TaxID=732238 RepID=A0A841HWK9_9GAMM|nr:PEP-CTERM sorting domain-containing protein [Povalibacter uvarum]MBB6096298.1 hypothetical protein [Povalibacter uvarum]
MKKAIQSLAFLLLAGMAVSANAVQIRIDFTGTVYSSYRFGDDGVAVLEPLYMGQSVVGWMLIETEGLDRTEWGSATADYLGFSDGPDAPDLITSSLMIGGTNVDIGAYSENGGGIQYTDSKGPISLEGGGTLMTHDQFSFDDASGEEIVDSATGASTYYGRSLYLGSAAIPEDPFDLSDSQAYIDLSQNLDALSSVYLPLQTESYRGLYGGYADACYGSGCATGDLSLAFEISSMVRQVIGVPEPSTLPLMGIAAFALLAVRRRRSLTDR